MTENPQNAPEPNSSEFLDEQNPIERVSPDTTADAPALDAEDDPMPTDPTLSKGGQ